MATLNKVVLMSLIALSVSAVPVVAGEKLPVIKLPPIKMPKLEGQKAPKLEGQKAPELEGQKKSNVQQNWRDRNTVEGVYAFSFVASSVTDSTAIGYSALGKAETRGVWLTGSHNTAVGVYALSSDTTGHHNTASGSGALTNNTTGDYNTASGAFALWRNTTGSHNTASGYQALGDCRGHSCRANTATGYGALNSNDQGSANTAVGYGALGKNRSAIRNTAVGALALGKNKGGGNTAIGTQALYQNNFGEHNTAIGTNAGNRNKHGNRNIFIGYQAGNSTTYQQVSDKLVIANGREPRNELITGNFRLHKVNINGDLHASGNVTTSDGRLKKDIKPLTHALDAILLLEGKTYSWKEDTTFANKQDIGLVAQDVEKVFPELVMENGQGYKGIAYSKLTAVLIEAMKEQQGQMTTQQQQMTAQQDQIATLEKENTQLKTIMAEQMQALLARVAMLEGETLAAN